jgi:hypothetical protein
MRSFANGQKKVKVINIAESGPSSQERHHAPLAQLGVFPLRRPLRSAPLVPFVLPHRPTHRFQRTVRPCCREPEACSVAGVRAAGLRCSCPSGPCCCPCSALLALLPGGASPLSPPAPYSTPTRSLPVRRPAGGSPAGDISFAFRCTGGHGAAAGHRPRRGPGPSVRRSAAPSWRCSPPLACTRLPPHRRP